VITFLFLITCDNVSAQEIFTVTQDSVSDDKEIFMLLEKIWNDAHLKGDTTTLSKLWADDIIIIVPRMPVFSKKDVLSMYKRVAVHFTVYESSNISVRKFNNMAIVTGIIHRVRQFGEKKAEEHWQFTKIYQKTDKEWYVISFQASEAPD
jgi:ketosteroid isomerase-like protein